MTRRTAAFLFAAFVLGACVPAQPPSGTASLSSTASPSVNPSVDPGGVVVLAAGDIGACDSEGDEATAAMLDELHGTILVLGDLAYPEGTAVDFASCYDTSWGRHKDRTRPVPGNHEYETDGAAAYFEYFGDVAGDPAEGWHAFDLGALRIIGLNSNCEEIGGCGAESPQGAWLREELETTQRACTLAYWHHPRWSSGEEHGSDDRTDELWRLLYDGGADIVLSAHDHEYERFVPMDADGTAASRGMVQFVVGTGGRSLYDFGAILPTSATHDNATYGVLQLTLHPDAYDWEFVSASGTRFSDSGSADCR